DDEAELCDRHAEAARGSADPQVALRRDLEPPADAGAVDHRDDRVAAARNRVHRRLEVLAVLLPRLRAAACLLELGDFAAGGERLVARAAQDDAAQGLVAVEFAHESAEALPHAEVERVQAPGVAERDGRDFAAARVEDLAWHQAMVRRTRSNAAETSGQKS